MNTPTAHRLIAQAAHLVELASAFQAKYGKYYPLKPGSPQDAWNYYEALLEVQCCIARLLDPAARENGYPKAGHWWDRHDVIDSATAQAVLSEIGSLIACCANQEIRMPENAEWSPIIHNTQCAVAGMLHPSSLQIASDETISISTG